MFKNILKDVATLYRGRGIVKVDHRSLDSRQRFEGFGDQLPEDVMADAIMFGHEAIAELCDMQLELAEKCGVEPPVVEAPEVNPFDEIVSERAYTRLKESKVGKSKADRHAISDEIKAELKGDEAMKTHIRRVRNPFTIFMTCKNNEGDFKLDPETKRRWKAVEYFAVCLPHLLV